MLFTALDEDGDGVVSRNEFPTKLRATGAPSATASGPPGPTTGNNWPATGQLAGTTGPAAGGASRGTTTGTSPPPVDYTKPYRDPGIPPTSPGCHIAMPTGCPWNMWHVAHNQTWYNDIVGRGSQAACDRVQSGYNTHCGRTDAMMTYKPHSPTTSSAPSPTTSSAPSPTASSFSGNPPASWVSFILVLCGALLVLVWFAMRKPRT